MKFSSDVGNNPSNPHLQRNQAIDVHILCIIKCNDTGIGHTNVFNTIFFKRLLVITASKLWIYRNTQHEYSCTLYRNNTKKLNLPAKLKLKCNDSNSVLSFNCK